MTETAFPAPIVDVSAATEVAPDLVVIPNRDLGLVPNIGVIGGSDAVLIVDTGLGPRQAEKVLAYATEYAAGRRLYLTTTHAHPEHAFGAQVFAGVATYVINSAQADDLAGSGAFALAQFRQLGPSVEPELEGIKLPTPDVTYDDAYELDLGGRVVQLRSTGLAHSPGDQVITVPDASTVFTGDLVETDQFAIFPWFPPAATAVSGVRWLEVMEDLYGDNPAVVVPGHGTVSGAPLLGVVRDYLAELRDETWVRREAGVPESVAAAEIRALMLQRRPDWRFPEWIERGVGCFYAER